MYALTKFLDCRREIAIIHITEDIKERKVLSVSHNYTVRRISIRSSVKTQTPWSDSINRLWTVTQKDAQTTLSALQSWHKPWFILCSQTWHKEIWTNFPFEIRFRNTVQSGNLILWNVLLGWFTFSQVSFSAENKLHLISKGNRLLWYYYQAFHHGNHTCQHYIKLCFYNQNSAAELMKSSQ